jgi:putative oxidoreductase
MIKLTQTTSDKSIVLIRLLVGLVFLSEGIQKFIFPELLGPGRFEKIGFADPVFWAYLTACFEIFCGLMVIFGVYVRVTLIPLLIIMIVAFFSTKMPLLLQKGFWPFAHEYRTDFAMTISLIILLMKGAGFYSFDFRMQKKDSHTIS